jgi:hypothetical protein
LIESKEANDVNAVHAGLHGLGGITLAQLTEADFEAVTWADQLLGVSLQRYGFPAIACGTPTLLV